MPKSYVRDPVETPRATPGAGSICPVIDADPRSTSRDEVRVLVYSSDSTTRTQVTTALGTTLHLPTAPDGPVSLVYVEVATQAAVLTHLDAGTIDLAILDGEASPAGGMGIAKQLKDEIDPCPPIVVLIGRPADDWLADWSRAEAVVVHPIDPIALSTAIAALLA